MRSEPLAKNGIWRALVGLAVVPTAAWCQTPVVSRAVDSASYQATLGSPGSIVSVFGTNLAAAAATAQAVPLPRQFGGTTVTWNGAAAPLFYVSPTQINLQVPPQADQAPGKANAADVVVSTASGISAPFDASIAVPSAWYAAGVFTMDASGCGQGALLNVASDGSVSVNSAKNSASPGDWISVYGTGIWVDALFPDGAATPLTPLAEAETVEGAEFDFQGLESAVSAEWTGLAPGYVGLDQSNVQIPAAVREGCAVPLQIEYGGPSQAVSQPVTIAIRHGGGPCVDPPVSGYGQITWQKTVNTSDLSEVSEADTVTISLQAAPGKQAPATPVYTDGCPPSSNVCDATLPSSLTLFGPACAVPGYRSLGAGTVTIRGPGRGPLPVPAVPYQQGQLGGLSAYQATLPAGAIQAGDFTVTASGGTDVGAFQAPVQIGADIQIQTALAGLAVFASCTPLTINWTGGDPNSWVTVGFVFQAPSAAGGYQSVDFAYQTRASNGTVTIPPPVPPANACGTTPPTPIEIVIEVDPDPSEITPFSAPGLSLDGQVTWRYIHTFQAGLELE